MLVDGIGTVKPRTLAEPFPKPQRPESAITGSPRERKTHSSNSKVPDDTPSNSTCYTSVLDLRRPRVGVHLGKLELSLGTGTLGKGSVANDVAESLTMLARKQLASSIPIILKDNMLWFCGENKDIPLGLVLLVHLALGVVADHTGVDKTAEI